MGVCSCTSKFVIIVINIFFWIGAALMVFAGVAYLDRADSVINDVDHKPAYVVFGTAGVLFLCGLVGIAGALSEKKFLLGLFAVIALAAVTLLIFATATMFVKHDNAINETDTFVLKQFNNYGNPNLTAVYSFDTMVAETTVSPSSGSGNGTTTAPDKNITTTIVTTTAPPTTAAPAPDMNATQFIDDIQTNLKCCGFNNYTDWNTYDYWTNIQNNKGYVPFSCCNETAAINKSCPTSGRISMKTDKALIYTNACEKEIHTVVNFIYHFANYLVLALTILVFLGFAASIYLMCRKRSSDGFNYSSIVA